MPANSALEALFRKLISWPNPWRRSVSISFLCNYHFLTILDFSNKFLFVFKSTGNNAHRGHVTDTQCKPDFTAAFDKHWCDDNTTLLPCIQLAGEDASAGKSKEQQQKQAISYLHYLLLARPDLYVAQWLLTSKRGVMFLLGIGGKSIRRFSVAWTHPKFYKLMYAFIFWLYDPGDFMDQFYVNMEPLVDQVTFTILISRRN